MISGENRSLDVDKHHSQTGRSESLDSQPGQVIFLRKEGRSKTRIHFILCQKMSLMEAILLMIGRRRFLVKGINPLAVILQSWGASRYGLRSGVRAKRRQGLGVRTVRLEP